MKWITRESPKIERIACPWLIARFIDDAPEFLYVPTIRYWPWRSRRVQRRMTFPAWK